MLAQSPKDRSRSPHRVNGVASNPPSSSSRSPSTTPSDSNSKAKKENDSQLRMKSLKLFIQTLINDSAALGATYDEQVKSLEGACFKEFRDLTHERIRRMIRSVFKARKSHAFAHQEHSPHANDSSSKKSRPSSTSANATTKSSDLVTPGASTLSALDADFLRHAFSQQFRPSLDLSAYFSAATSPTGNGTSSTSALFRPNFSPSNFLQSLTAPPPPLSTPLVASHPHANGTAESSSTASVGKLPKASKLSSGELSSIKVLVNAYREAAAYLSRSADELEQLI